MIETRWQRIKAIFDEAVELDDAERPAFLDRACSAGGETRREVERMLEADPCSIDPLQSVAVIADEFLREQARSEYLVPGATLLDRFEIVRLIGSGGMGQVYEANDRLSEPVALKIVRPALRWDPEASERFRQEVRLAQRVSHPNVCRIHAVFEGSYRAPTSIGGANARLTFLTMELIEGITLKDHLRLNGPIPPADALPLARQMAEALDAAHAEGVVHCDFKSGNVMFTQSREGGTRVKITDFGLAGEVLRSAPELDEATAGTPDYMAPEQILRQPFGCPADIFAFGVVLHEMISGQLPFPALQGLTDARQRWQPAAPRFAATLAASLPKLWAEAIRRCLEPVPMARPVTARSVIEVLEGKGNPWTRRAIIGGATMAVSTLVGARYGGEWVRSNWFAVPVGSLAVLPFAHEAAEADLGSLSSGLTDELIATLATVPNLRVVARGSVSRFDREPVDWSAAARTLGVQALLVGKVRRQGDLIRVDARLINGVDGKEIWGQTYDHPVASAATLPSRMSLAMATALRLRLASAAGGGSLRLHSTVPRAYELFLLGKQSAAKRTVPAIEEAVRHFEEAIALDDRYALAWAGLAEASNLLAGRSGYLPNEWFPKVERAARRALELDPNLPEAHLWLGSLYQRFYWDWDQAERHYQLAVQLGPGLAVAHHRYAGFLSNLGYHERALQQIREARELDPLSLAVNNAYGAFLARAEKLDEAILQLQLVTKLDANFPAAYTFLGESYEGKGMWDEAIAYFRRALEFDPQDLSGQGDLGYALARAGRLDEARTVLQQLRRQNNPPPSAVADVYKGLGEKDNAFEWLEKAYLSRDPYLMLLKVDRRNGLLRGDPRFSQLAARLKLP